MNAFAGSMNVAGAPGAGRAAGPADELEAKRQKLKSELDQITELNRSASSLQGEIKALEAKIAEVSAAAQAFRTAADSLAPRLKKLAASAAQKAGSAQASLKEDQKRVDKAVSDVDAALAAQEDDAKKAADQAALAAKALLDAQGEAAASQQSYDALKAHAQQLTATITAAEGLLAQAGAAEEKNDDAALYVLATEAGRMVKDLSIGTPDDFAAELQARQDAASAGKAKAGAAAAANEAAGRKAAELASRHAAAKASRLADLLAALRK